MSYMTMGVSNQIPTVIGMLVVIIIVGVIGNSLVVVVYSLKQDKLNATLFILVLAVSDLLCCLSSIPITVYFEYVEWEMRSELLCKSYYFLNNSFIPFSSLLITCIAFDRYFCLCHPFRRILTLTRAKRLIGVVVMLAIMIGTSSTFTVRVLETRGDSNQTAVYECSEVIRINASEVDKIVYEIVQKTQIGSYILCIASVMVLYVLIYRSVSKVYKKRKLLKGPNTSKDVLRSAINQTVIVEPSANNADGIQIDYADEETNNGSTSLPLKHTPDNPQSEHQSNDQSIIGNQLTVPKSSRFERRSKSGAEIEHDPPSSIFNQFSHEEAAKLKRSIKQLRDTTTFQNLKTASMLFVVAILYIVTFLPAMLMASGWLDLYLPIFYLYYVNNAINPVVYGFMNPNFRQDIRKLFCRT